MARIGWSRSATLEALYEARKRALTVAGHLMDLGSEVEGSPAPFPYDLKRSSEKAYKVADACRDAYHELSGGVSWLPSRLMLPGLLKSIELYERHYRDCADGVKAGRQVFRNSAFSRNDDDSPN